MATKDENSEPQTTSDVKSTWKTGIQQTLATARKKLLEAQAMYTKNYDNRLRRDRTLIKLEDCVLHPVERRDDKETRYKLALIAEGTCRVKEVDTVNNTVFIERETRSTETIS